MKLTNRQLQALTTNINELLELRKLAQQANDTQMKRNFEERLKESKSTLFIIGYIAFFNWSTKQYELHYIGEEQN
jgi:hypothetical protein